MSFDHLRDICSAARSLSFQLNYSTAPDIHNLLLPVFQSRRQLSPCFDHSSFPPCQGSTAKKGRSAPQKRDAFGPSFAVPAVNFNGKWRRDPAAAVPLYWGTFWLPPSQND